MKTLLFVEDDAAYRDITERLYAMCQKCFHGEVSFVTASTWTAGLEIMRKDSIDVAIVDLTLPPLTRYETLTAIQQENGLPPFVVLTGHEGDNELRTKAILAGAEDFLLKSEVRRHPEILCERVYLAYLRRNRERLNHEQRT